MNILNSFFLYYFSKKSPFLDADHPFTECSAQILDTIPQEVILEIFTYLSFKDLKNVCCASKKWSKLSHNPQLGLKCYDQLLKIILKQLTKFRTKFSEALRYQGCLELPENPEQFYKISFMETPPLQIEIMEKHGEDNDDSQSSVIKEIWGKKTSCPYYSFDVHFIKCVSVHWINGKTNRENELIHKIESSLNKRIVQENRKNLPFIEI